MVVVTLIISFAICCYSSFYVIRLLSSFRQHYVNVYVQLDHTLRQKISATLKLVNNDVLKQFSHTNLSEIELILLQLEKELDLNLASLDQQYSLTSNLQIEKSLDIQIKSLEQFILNTDEVVDRGTVLNDIKQIESLSLDREYAKSAFNSAVARYNYYRDKFPHIYVALTSGFRQAKEI